MKKNCTTKNHIKAEHKKRHISEIQGTKSKTLFSHEPNRQHTHNALTTEKIVAAYFEDVKTEETFSSQDHKLVETTNLRQFFGQKTTTAQIRICNDR